MTSAVRTLCVSLGTAFVLLVSANAQNPARTAPRKPAAKPVATKTPSAETTAARKSALDKAVLDAYVRHLFVWGSQVQVNIHDPKPSERLPGFNEVLVDGKQGNFTQQEKFYVSKDGQKILRAMVFDVNENPFKPELEKLKTEFQPSIGTPGAPVVLVLFSDFQCSFCREEAKMLRRDLLSAYPKQVRLYFKDFPLEAIHPWARTASVYGRCIFRLNPGAFWEYHDWIYENQAQITPENIKAKVLDFAKGKELDTLQLSQCMDARSTESEVDRNMADGKALDVNSTPTVFINGRRLVGQVGWPDLRRIIDYELEYQKTARNAGEDCGCETTLGSPAGFGK